DDGKTVKAVNNLADALMKKDAKSADSLAKSIAKAADREEVMNLLGVADQGGIGFGAKKESFEMKIDALGKKGISKDDLEKQQKHLKRMAELTIAVSQVTEHYVGKAGNAKKMGLWKTYSADFQAKSRDFLEAVNKSDPAAIKASATKLSG